MDPSKGPDEERRTTTSANVVVRPPTSTNADVNPYQKCVFSVWVGFCNRSTSLLPVRALRQGRKRLWESWVPRTAGGLSGPKMLAWCGISHGSPEIEDTAGRVGYLKPTRQIKERRTILVYHHFPHHAAAAQEHCEQRTKQECKMKERKHCSVSGWKNMVSRWKGVCA